MDERVENEMKTRLLEERDRLKRIINEMDEGELNEGMSDSVTELSRYDQHASDLGLETFERGKDIALRENEQLNLKQIERALERLEKGTYGVCERCGKRIPEERLQALPQATLCTGCQEQVQGQPGEANQSRPVEEEVLYPPFGRVDRDDDDYTGFDGEDAWQAVARYGTANSPQDTGGAGDPVASFVENDESVGFAQDVEKVIDERGDGTTDTGRVYRKTKQR